MKQFGWGIVGPGAIAHRFMNDLPRCPRARLQAVSSRSADRSQAFADQYGFASHYGSFEDMLADPLVDIVYIATPHPQHYAAVLSALDAGKAVLCEKPATVNAPQLARILDKAKEKQRFFMEAMWTRFFPVNLEVAKRIHSGQYGLLTLAEVDFCGGKWSNKNASDPAFRLYSPELAGGSLLDIGVYCLSYAHYMKKQAPSRFTALATMTDTNVDATTVMTLSYDDDTMATLRSSILFSSPNSAILHCERATIEVEDFWHPQKATITTADGKTEIIEDAYSQSGSTGFQYEANGVMDALEEGNLEHPVMSWQQSLQIMELMDSIREEIGLKYPDHVESLNLA